MHALDCLRKPHWPTHGALTVGHLPVQVALLHQVVVHNAERAHAGTRQVERDGASEPAGADHQHCRRAQLRLRACAIVMACINNGQ